MNGLTSVSSLLLIILYRRRRSARRCCALVKRVSQLAILRCWQFPLRFLKYETCLGNAVHASVHCLCELPSGHSRVGSCLKLSKRLAQVGTSERWRSSSLAT